MRPRRFAVATVLGTLVGCYSPPQAPAGARPGVHEPAELTFQAVDAGTGGTLEDREMTVRYLVRAPIAFDAAAVDRVPSQEPYTISHDVAEPNLVLEVRVEADSYHRLDTVLTVAKGTSAGPLTVRLSRRLGVVVQNPPPRQPTQPVVTTPAGEDRTPLEAGNRAFAQGQWLSATESFQRMPAPRSETSAYGRDYLEAKTSQGIAHINRSEFARALEVLEEAAALDSPGPDTFLRLAEAQCAVGRTEEGRGSLASLGRARSRMEPLEQNRVTALIQYRRGVCSQGVFERAQTTLERISAGGDAMRELEGFVQGAEQMSPRSQDVTQAIDDAKRRIETIRRTISGA